MRVRLALSFVATVTTILCNLQAYEMTKSASENPKVNELTQAEGSSKLDARGPVSAAAAAVVEGSGGVPIKAESLTQQEAHKAADSSSRHGRLAAAVNEQQLLQQTDGASEAEGRAAAPRNLEAEADRTSHQTPERPELAALKVNAADSRLAENGYSVLSRKGEERGGSRMNDAGEASSRSFESAKLVTSCFALNRRIAGGKVAQAVETLKACRAECRSRAGCSHLNFLRNPLTCELVFASGKQPLDHLLSTKEYAGAVAASVECELPAELQLPASGGPLVIQENANFERTKQAESSLLTPQRPHAESAASAGEAAKREARTLQESGDNEPNEPVGGPQRSQVCSDRYVLSDTYQGNDFWEPSNFFFFEWGDPTGGTVEYVNKSVAQKYQLIRTTSDGRAQIFADTTERLAAGKGRKSIRITSQKAWRDAMWVMNLSHMPTGCGTWPAWWTVGWDPWPDTGEIDVIEGANLQDHAHSALHTKKGCTMPSSTSKFNGYWSKTNSGLALDCWNLATPDNTGCSIESYEDAYGGPLNRKGGGYYVMQLHHDKYIRIWFFTRQEAPSDLVSGSPTPDFWTKTPLAYFPLGSSCPGSHFQEQRIVLNTTFCGGYSGNSFTSAQGCPGNGLADCEAYVRNNPSAFREAFWDISFMKVYKRSGQTCQEAATQTATTTKRTTLVLLLSVGLCGCICYHQNDSNNEMDCLARRKRRPDV